MLLCPGGAHALLASELKGVQGELMFTADQVIR